jgi:hypothetical protein
MTLEIFKSSQRRHMHVVVRRLGIAGLIVFSLLAISAGVAGNQTAANGRPMGSEMQQMMHSQMQDMMIMSQNTAVWTPAGLVVLQGNRLLHYSADLQLRHNVSLPVPQDLANALALSPQASKWLNNAAIGIEPSIRSQVSVQILPTADGIVVVRGQQLIMLDSSFKITGQATLPALPELTPAELAVVCPMSHAPAPNGGMFMGSAEQRAKQMQSTLAATTGFPADSVK